MGGDKLKRNCPWKVWQELCTGVSGAGKCYGGHDRQATGSWGRWQQDTQGAEGASGVKGVAS